LRGRQGSERGAEGGMRERVREGKGGGSWLVARTRVPSCHKPVIGAFGTEQLLVRAVLDDTALGHDDSGQILKKSLA
jgi:hypothetical protein